MYELVLSHSGKEVLAIPLDEERIQIGRSHHSDFCLPDPFVSWNQLELQVQGDRVRIQNLSQRGTLLNGKPVSAAELKPSDKIEFAGFSSRLREIDQTKIATVTAAGGATSKIKGDPAPLSGMVLTGSFAGKTMGISLQGDAVDIGSDERNHLIVDDIYVSGFHCRAYAYKDGWYVRDLDSTNGTYVNGVFVKDAKLEPGSVLKLGRVPLRVETKDKSEQNSRLGGFISMDPATEQMLDMVRLAAPLDEPVLITGESGTGKELLANAIHAHSKRAAKPMVAINCATFSKQLLENELFGHEKGAFTDAKGMKKGLFEAADGGTLFLDEFGEMDLEIQAKLHRALEYGEIRRLGSDAAILVDVRCIAATNQSLLALIRRGRFREDLYYRICAHEIEIPPLRARPKDIRMLAEHYLDLYTRSTNKPKFSGEALHRLCSYGYPGNVRELKYIVSRAILSAAANKSSIIQAYDLSFKSPADMDEFPDPREYEAARIVKALTLVDGNRTKAAKLLKMPRSTLISKIKKLGLGR